ncbi:hypothetical protein NECAME_07316 [Necator americanus]|uniref:Uncharacterized protein n=1 Tax=Necator americanus TaxID=51031 RepID=W2TRE5_NECAM|nr:hypothetical protein NECAME_07316 [Necator americanus]ETN83607.1 hypothetical protein NECAME_07316 [Necator americanus]
MTEEDKEEYAVAERHVSRMLEQMILLTPKFRPSHVLCIITASLLNIMGMEHGAFAGCSGRFKVLIGDEASKIPEPELAALANLLPKVQQVYIRDIHQLELHAKCHRESNPGIYGACSIMSVLWSALAVPVAPLLRTYRDHPTLNELPNKVAYEGALVSGLESERRMLLLHTLTFPTPTIPFINVNGQSEGAANMSHYNCTGGGIMPGAFAPRSDTSPDLHQNILSRTVLPDRAGSRRTRCGAIHSRLRRRKRER